MVNRARLKLVQHCLAGCLTCLLQVLPATAGIIAAVVACHHRMACLLMMIIAANAQIYLVCVPCR